MAARAASRYDALVERLMTRRGPPPGARHQCVRVGISLRGGSARALPSRTMARFGAVATSANRRLGASRQVSPLGEDFTPSPPSPGARSQGGEVGVLREWTRVSHVPGAHRVSGNCNHVDETLEMRYTSLRTAYPFPPRELPHTLGVRVQRGHSEPLLPSHHSPVCLFGPWPPSLSQDPRTGSRLASGRWHLVPPYACEPSRPIRVWDAMSRGWSGGLTQGRSRWERGRRLQRTQQLSGVPFRCSEMCPDVC